MPEAARERGITYWLAWIVWPGPAIAVIFWALLSQGFEPRHPLQHSSFVTFLLAGIGIPLLCGVGMIFIVVVRHIRHQKAFRSFSASSLNFLPTAALAWLVAAGFSTDLQSGARGSSEETVLLRVQHQERTWWRMRYAASVGFAGPDGNYVIKPVFDEAYSFRDSRAVVQIGEKFGVIDPSGAWVVTPQYDAAGSYFREGVLNVRRAGSAGFIDLSGNEIVPMVFEATRLYSEGLAPAKAGGLWGYIDEIGEFAIEPQFTFAKGFSEGVAPVYIGGSWVCRTRLSLTRPTRCRLL